MAAPDEFPTNWVFTALLGILSWLGLNTMKRVSKLEEERQTTVKAALDRAEIKQEIRDLSDRMDDQHNRMFDRLDELSAQINRGMRT